jgi:hypothetical protein
MFVFLILLMATLAAAGPNLPLRDPKVDQVVLTKFEGGTPAPGTVPDMKMAVISGEKFNRIEKEVAAVVHTFGRKRYWTDCKPGDPCILASIDYHRKHYDLGCKQPLSDQNPFAAFWQTLRRDGLEPASGS